VRSSIVHDVVAVPVRVRRRALLLATLLCASPFVTACDRDRDEAPPKPVPVDPDPKPAEPKPEPKPAELELAPIFEGRDFRVRPPVVRKAEAEIIDVQRGEVKLRVSFEERSLPRVLVIEHEGRRIALRDDGKQGDEKPDGVFTARAKLDLAGLTKAQARVEFEGRVMKPPIELAGIDLGKLRPGSRFPLDRSSIAASEIVADSSLVITNLAVVEDPARTFNPCTDTGTRGGKWTFGHLVREMANQSATGIAPESLARRWVDEWMTAQSINTFDDPARTRMSTLVIEPWLAASGGTTLDLDEAPFKLIAIVNRVDLADNLAYGSGSAGEGRFVFAALDRRNGACEPLQFTVIFEYGIGATGCSGLRAWAQRWHDLGGNPVGSSAYNAALESITDTFTAAGAAPAKVNGSALNQLRTNEVPLANFWELREFRLDSLDAGFLRQVTVKQTPAIGLDRTVRLNDYLLANEAAVLGETHEVPMEFPTGQPFLGAAAPIMTPAFVWRGAATPAITPDLRFHYSLNTCNGCHAGETGTSFTHISPAGFGTEAELSGFMTGIDVNVDGLPNPRHFDDLQRRRQAMADVLGRTCFVLPNLGRFNTMIH
jgi:hypothetical protein